MSIVIALIFAVVAVFFWRVALAVLVVVLFALVLLGFLAAIEALQGNPLNVVVAVRAVCVALA